MSKELMSTEELRREIRLQEFYYLEVDSSTLHLLRKTEEKYEKLENYLNAIKKGVYRNAERFREERNSPYYIDGLVHSFWYGGGIGCQLCLTLNHQPSGKNKSIVGNYLFMRLNENETGVKIESWDSYVDWLKERSNTYKNLREERPDWYHTIAEFIEVCLYVENLMQRKMRSAGFNTVKDKGGLISLVEHNPLLYESQAFDDGACLLKPRRKW